MEAYIQQLISEGEHQQLDFKFEIADSRKIAWTYSAFANSRGGRILVGVKDNGKIAGIRTEEEVHMIRGAADLYCNPVIQPEITTWQSAGKTVLEVYIEPASIRPVYAKDEYNRWRAWVRINDENFQANSVLIKSWTRKKGTKGTFVEITRKEELFFSYLKKHHEISFSKTQKLLKLNRSQTEDFLVNFLALDTIKMHFDNRGVRYQIKKNEED